MFRMSGGVAFLRRDALLIRRRLFPRLAAFDSTSRVPAPGQGGALRWGDEERALPPAVGQPLRFLNGAAQLKTGAAKADKKPSPKSPGTLPVVIIGGGDWNRDLPNTPRTDALAYYPLQLEEVSSSPPTMTLIAERGESGRCAAHWSAQERKPHPN